MKCIANESTVEWRVVLRQDQANTCHRAKSMTRTGPHQTDHEDDDKNEKQAGKVQTGKPAALPTLSLPSQQYKTKHNTSPNTAQHTHRAHAEQW